MKRLAVISQRRLKNVKLLFERYLCKDIDWSQRLIIISGARGTGKTTMLLQQMKKTKTKSIYLSLDDFYFEENRLVLLIDELYKKSYRNFFLDEVHQYPHWSKDLKNIFDNYEDVNIVATGSSILKIHKGESDLSRRASTYYLHGFSFREFLSFNHKIDLPFYTLNEILDHHPKISLEISDSVDVLNFFQDYLNFGYYPFFDKNPMFYHQKLQRIIQLIIEVDIPAVESISYSTTRGMRKLLFVLSQSVPFSPNIQALATKIGTSRNSILKSLDFFNQSNVLNLLHTTNNSASYLQKPEKIYLENPNLCYTFSGSTPNKGNLRETFFLNQLKLKHSVNSSKFADFMVDKTYTFEVGGATKTGKQISGVPLAYIAADDLKFGSANKIPLWLFGFLY